MSIVFAEVEFLDVIRRIQVSSLERLGGCHRGEFLDELAGGTFKIDVAAVPYRIIIDPGEVDRVFQALLNWASTVKMMLVAPLLVPVL